MQRTPERELSVKMSSSSPVSSSVEVPKMLSSSAGSSSVEIPKMLSSSAGSSSVEIPKMSSSAESSSVELPKMSSSAGSSSMEITKKLSSSSESSSVEILEVDCLKQKNTVLAHENIELRNMLTLMQENLMLRYTLREHESRVRGLPPPRRRHKAPKDSKEVNDSNNLTDSSDSEDVKVPEDQREEPEPLPSNKPEEKRQEAEPLPSNKPEDQKEEPEPLPLNTDTNAIKEERKPVAWHRRPCYKLSKFLDRYREKKEDPESLPEHEKKEDPESLPEHESEKPSRSQQIVGEIGFQLDRRILSAVIREARLYGHCMANIQDKILQHSTCKLSGQVNEELRATMTQRYKDLMERLRTLGYDPIVHVPFTEDLVNSNGIVKELPDVGTEERTRLDDPEYLRGIINDCVPGDMLPSVHVLLNCLALLAQEDGNPLFIW
ncbi:speriolin-like protein [Pseudophryne corroboree]|uniref:speriolin-like protein n=1 Tax=Pseudophryne corroboree TaxID=495146 RepID=UPI003081267B